MTTDFLLSLPARQLWTVWAAFRCSAPAASELRGFSRRDIDVPGVKWRRITFRPTSDPALAPFDAAV